MTNPDSLTRRVALNLPLPTVAAVDALASSEGIDRSDWLRRLIYGAIEAKSKGIIDLIAKRLGFLQARQEKALQEHFSHLQVWLQAEHRALQHSIAYVQQQSVLGATAALALATRSAGPAVLAELVKAAEIEFERLQREFETEAHRLRDEVEQTSRTRAGWSGGDR